jgi:hypothetical protein
MNHQCRIVSCQIPYLRRVPTLSYLDVVKGMHKKRWARDVIILVAQFAFTPTVMEALFPKSYDSYDMHFQACYSCGLVPERWTNVERFIFADDMYMHDCCSLKCIRTEEKRAEHSQFMFEMKYGDDPIYSLRDLFRKEA